MDSTKVSVPLKGLQTDVAPHNLSEDQYTYALNASYENFNGDGFPTIQNDSSNLLTVSFSEGYKVIGQIYIVEQDRAIYFLVNSKIGNSQIIEILNINSYFEDKTDSIYIDLNTCIDCDQEISVPLNTMAYATKYHIIIESSCLNFNENYPIDIEYKITDCTLQLYFVDNYNVDRYLYFDYVNENSNNVLKVQQKFFEIVGYEDNACKQPIYSDILDCDKLRIQPNIKRPQLKLSEVINGGNLVAGVYQFLVAYASSTGEVLSSYYGLTNIIPIKTRDVTFETDYQTDRAITLTINELSLDTIYRYYNLVVIETIDNFSTYKLVGTFPITQNNYTYTGNPEATKLTENDIIQKYPYYKNSKSITKSNNYLFRANLEEYTKPNLQRIAEHIHPYWQTIQIPEGEYNNPVATNKFRSYMRDEIYSLALVPEYDNGEDGAAIILVGRKANSYDLETIGNKDVIEKQKCDNIIRNKRWEIYNTATIIETPHNAYNGCDYLPWEWGEFSYWESTELYPNNPLIWGDLCGKPIRHFKFPDSTITHIHDGLNGINGYGENNMIYPIGIRIDHNSVIRALQIAVDEKIISQEERNRIVSYRVVRANRVGNKSVIAKGLLYDVWSYKKKNQVYHYPNYPYNDLSPDVFLASNDFYKKISVPKDQVFKNEGRYTFHSPDTHFTEPSLGNELKLETEEYGFSRGFFNECEGQAKFKLLSKDIHQLALTFALLLADSNVKTSSSSDGTVWNAAKTGLQLGTSIGTAINPGIGTVIGAAAGLIIGGVVGLIIKDKAAPLKSLVESLTKLSLALVNYENLISLFKSFVPFHNYTIQYNSIGKYNNYLPVFNEGNKIRNISQWNYLKPEVNSISDGTKSILFNNFQRESSVYLKTSETLLPTSKKDLSRVKMESIGCSLNTDIDSPIASYYASIKNNRINQYGNIYNMQFLETNGNSYYLNQPQTVSVFGGDIFINRMALKRKHPFFIATPYLLPNDTDWYFSDYANVAYPKYYFNTLGNNDLYIGNFLQLYDMRAAYFAKKTFNLDAAGFIGESRIPNINLECLQDGRFNLKDLTKITSRGYVYLYSYGIPYFLCESDFNVDYRHAEDNKINDFYPRQQDLTYWLQEKNVPIREDNTYHYNNTYSKQEKESFIFTNDASFEPSRVCKVTYPNRVIYSQQSDNIDNSSLKDDWLTFKANNKYDFSLTDGKLISVEGIENDKVLTRFENTIKVFNAYNTLQTNADTIQIDTGGIFQSKPQEYSNTTLGYGGTQHRAILHTEYGHITVDAKRGQVISISEKGLDEISKNGMKNWFKENLPFKIAKSFPELSEELDNAYKGIGIVMSFDKRFNRFFLTKLDYKPKSKEIKYDSINKYFYIGSSYEEISLSDNQYFDNASWTLSYNFHTQSWVSFHSFIPNYYLDTINFFLSGINNNSNRYGESSLWAHNLTNKSFQNYYGKLNPFIVELVRKFSIEKNVLTSVNYSADVIQYHNKYDKFYNKDIIPFNRGIIYNNNQTTGLIEFEKKNYNDLSLFLNYPIIQHNKSTIEIVNKEGEWKFNNFYDFAKNQTNNIPLFLSNVSNSYSRINYNALDYSKIDLNKNRLRGDWFRFKFINDKETNYKIILKYLINKSKISFS